MFLKVKLESVVAADGVSGCLITPRDSGPSRPPDVSLRFSPAAFVSLRFCSDVRIALPLSRLPDYRSSSVVRDAGSQ